jgi:hypothetical protein
MRFHFSLRHLWIAVAGVAGSVGGFPLSTDARPPATADRDRVEMTTDRDILNERVDRVRAALHAEKPATGRGDRSFTQWFNWNNWNNGWNNWYNL